MGRSFTPKYVIELYFGNGTCSGRMPWNGRMDGLPRLPNVERYVRTFQASTEPGGRNAHLGALRVLRAYVFENRLDPDVVCVWPEGSDPHLKMAPIEGDAHVR